MKNSFIDALSLLSDPSLLSLATCYFASLFLGIQPEALEASLLRYHAEKI